MAININPIKPTRIEIIKDRLNPGATIKNTSTISGGNGAPVKTGAGIGSGNTQR